MGMDVYRFTVCSKVEEDPHSLAYTHGARALGLSQVEKIKFYELYFIEGSLRPSDLDILATVILSDPVTQQVTCAKIDPHVAQIDQNDSTSAVVEVAYHPGVTDPVAEQIVRAAHVQGIGGVERAATGQRFYITGSGLDPEYIHLLAARFLSNATIQTYALGEITPVFPQPAESSGAVERFEIQGFDQDALLALSKDRRTALDLNEMLAIQAYFREEGRAITDIELETLAQTWSEHCVHKTFKAEITITNARESVSPTWRAQAKINGILKTYLRAATEQISPWWLRSAFVDNAGIVDFDGQNEVSFKVETHNHPSAIEPFGGANTGVGGVIRDVIGVSAKPIAATDVLCFGPASQSFEDLPPGVLHPRRIRSGVVSGVQDYGNKIGIPTASGAIYYDPGYTANPLVFCGCVGIAPKDSHRRTPRPGDRVIVLGGRTGRDGLRGATFSSMTMDAQTGQVAGASVQIGAPIVEKGLIDVILLARDQGLYSAITDCGAGGLSSAVGEMASIIGAEVDLKAVRLKYPGLAPWEIWLSEAQERMVLAVPGESLPQLEALCQIYAVELTDMGSFTGSGRLVVRYGDRTVLNLSNAFLHEGIPQRKLEAILPAAGIEKAPAPLVEVDLRAALLALLSHPNIASKESIVRIYDHEVQGGTAVKPLTGVKEDGPSDAVVLKPIGTQGKTAIVLGAGMNPEYSKFNAYRMALSVVDEAIRNVVCVGGDPDRIALLDNFCWGDPQDPHTLGTLVEASRGCHDAAVYFGTPFISGKDSLNNEYMGKDGQRHAIPPTLLVSSLGVIENLEETVTMDLKIPGDAIYLLGDFQPRLQGSHLSIAVPLASEMTFQDGVPNLAATTLNAYRALHQAIKSGFVNACHDLSEGGFLVAAAEMCIGGRLGMEIEIPPGDAAYLGFGETNGCILIEVPAEKAASFERMLKDLPLRRVGTVLGETQLTVKQEGKALVKTAVEDLVAAWKTQD